MAISAESVICLEEAKLMSSMPGQPSDRAITPASVIETSKLMNRIPGQPLDNTMIPTSAMLEPKVKIV